MLPINKIVAKGVTFKNRDGGTTTCTASLTRGGAFELTLESGEVMFKIPYDRLMFKGEMTPFAFRNEIWRTLSGGLAKNHKWDVFYSGAVEYFDRKGNELPRPEKEIIAENRINHGWYYNGCNVLTLPDGSETWDGLPYEEWSRRHA